MRCSLARYQDFLKIPLKSVHSYSKQHPSHRLLGRGNNIRWWENTQKQFCGFVFCVFGTDLNPHFNTHLTIFGKPQWTTVTPPAHVTCPIKHTCLLVCWIYLVTVVQSVCKCQFPDSNSRFGLLSLIVTALAGLTYLTQNPTLLTSKQSLYLW